MKSIYGLFYVFFFAPHNKFAPAGRFLLLAELIGADAQMSVYDGYSIYNAYRPMNESAIFAQDALDALDYARGDASTTWGARRVADGFPAPFALPRLEVSRVTLAPVLQQ